VTLLLEYVRDEIDELRLGERAEAEDLGKGVKASAWATS
jgi:hypothetical protein